ncbi:MAG: hypothetical protein VYE64_08730, partial [Planctomycetota bacterium]|nr:hypothetical protein [Planctomycetota bacterium]
MNRLIGILSGFLLLAVCFESGNRASGQLVSNLQVPEGFRVTKFAGDDLATNIFSMALDPEGRVVVSGPGYIRRLIDRDGDGVADDFEEIFRPKQGAQGMHFEKQGDVTFLYFVGDGGLWSVADTDRDGVTDTAPKQILSLKTGGEHDSHSIQRGPDGCLYLLCGNGVPIKAEYFNDPDSPVQAPQAGFLMKIGPEGKRNSIVAHGFRNAYDFAFNRQGQIFTFDSDGERDVSLPWYRPTRVFQLTPGDHAGFIGASWKRPSYYFDMPREIGALGRGSPTGVACYVGEAFPIEYHNSILVGDWTFGQIFCFRFDSESGNYDRGRKFAVADGQFGFAVTDLVVGSQGELWVSVGGRGTEGGVYRIDYREDSGPVEGSLESKDPADVDAPTAGHPLNLVDRLRKPERDALGSLWNEVRALAVERRLELEQMELPPVSRCLIRLAEDVASNEGRVERLLFCMEMLAQAGPDWRGSLIRCTQLALGGAGRPDGAAVFHGYQAIEPVELDTDQSAELSRKMVELLPSCGLIDRQELGRLAAMLGVESSALVDGLAAQAGPESRVVDDIHWLICIAKLGSSSSNETAQRVADMIVQLPGKMEKEALQIDRHWVPRMTSVVEVLFESAGVTRAVVKHAELGRPEHVYLYRRLPASLQREAATRFLEAVRQSPEHVTAEQLLITVSTDRDRSKSL